MIWFLLPAALIAGAEQPQVPMTRTSETIRVSVIEVDVVVLDANGKPVAGLTRDDFELKIGGRRRPISNFYGIDRRTADVSGAVPAATQSPPAAVARRDYLVLFIDNLHLDQHEKKRALDALGAFTSQHVRPGTAAMLVASDGDVRVLQRFTEDSSLLIRKIDALEHQPGHVSQYQSQRRELLNLIDIAKGEKEKDQLAEIVRQQIVSVARYEQLMTERTIAALDHVIHAVAGLDGRRVLVYLSDGVPMQPGAEIFQYYRPDEFLTGGPSDRAKRVAGQFQPLDAMSVNLNANFLQLARETAAAGVQFFAIDARGVRGFDAATPDNPATTTRLDSSLIRANLHGPIRLLADETGGQAITDQNDLGIAFAKLNDHLSTYYSLGFRSDNSGREADIDVRVKKRGLTVRAVKHVRQRSTREQIADRVRAALYTRIEENPLGAKVVLAPLTGSESGLKATIRIPLAGLSILPDEKGHGTSFAVFVAMLDENMRETPVRMFVHRVARSEFAESIQSLTFDLQPGTYAVSFGVVDSFSWQASYLQREVTILSAK
jgi:VWFA-related protein